MTLVLDNIIFGLQRFGGISTYWSRLVEHATRERPDTAWVMPRDITFAGQLTALPSTVRRQGLPNRVARYLSCPLPTDGTVFHSSYYRLPARRVRRLVTTVHDFTYERYRKGLPLFVHRREKQLSIAAADVVVCVSQSTRNDLLNHFPKIDSSKVIVIPLAVDATMFSPRHGSSNEAVQPYALYVGQRGGYKRFDLAVAAVARSDDIALGIVGPPLNPDERQLLAEQLGTRWIEFGPVDNARLGQLYRGAEMFLFPSDYEGFGLPILEAMSCDCPVVAADRSSFPEVAGDAALLVAEQNAYAYADAIATVRETGQRAALVAAGRRQVTRFSWEKTLAATMTCYS
ncbi:glycosyltransferase family 1 protein [uncultured Sphingomonas sp.]|uniref:glycosyltransferase family 4 protein n=1 Tax=uncultured Sphingomonas sp. TaxID=158754 RepID=UPI0025D46AB6|nr:glycosyltransferase family 1 protein [uncultured Sphingomonas sp.]